MENWVNIDLSSGYGSQNITVDVDENTGRNERVSVMEIYTTNTNNVKRVNIIQDGTEEFVSFQNLEYNFGENQTLTITGLSNSKSLDFVIQDNEYFSIASTYNVNGDDIPLGDDIPNDIGQDNQYSFSIVVNIDSDPENNVNIPLYVYCENKNRYDFCSIVKTTQKTRMLLGVYDRNSGNYILLGSNNKILGKTL